MNGIEAAVLAVSDAGVGALTYVPGYPITRLAEALGAEIAVNEKVALEVALGASATGSRSMVLVKQVGMNVLADPLVISATHTIGSGVVVVAGDDLGPVGSQAEMDSRIYGSLAELPVLDPRDPKALHDSILEAYQLSEWLRIPVILRVTERLLFTEGPAVRSRPFKGRGLVFDRTSWELTARGKHQKHRYDMLRFAEEASEATSLNRLEVSGDVGIIASGYPASLVTDLGVSVFFVGYAYPLPWKMIRRFVDGHRLVLVAEEPRAFIETQLGTSPKVKGKITGHLPFGLLERSDLIGALKTLDENPEIEQHSYETAGERGYSGICQDCPFIPIYRALGKLDALVAGDAGCVIKGTREPYNSVDVVFGLGSSIGVASGFKRKGVAVLGDYALAHSAIQGLINAVWRRKEVLAVVLQNEVAAMTGGQIAPDLTKLLEALVPTLYIDLPASEKDMETIMRRELKRPGVSAIVARGRCARHG
jgi:indolepyruvate ferredoxin oxidoreductase alpha subunit